MERRNVKRTSIGWLVVLLARSLVCLFLFSWQVAFFYCIVRTSHHNPSLSTSSPPKPLVSTCVCPLPALRLLCLLAYCPLLVMALWSLGISCKGEECARAHVMLGARLLGVFARDREFGVVAHDLEEEGWMRSLRVCDEDEGG